MKQIDLREGARRQHRSIALFAVIQCWLRKLDGVAFKRVDLERLLGLERFKQTRIEWLEEDLREFFPYQTTKTWANKPGWSFAAIYVSRVPIEDFLPGGNISTEERIKRMPKKGPRLGVFELWEDSHTKNAAKVFKDAVPFFADSANYDERLLSSYLALLAQGQISPQSLPKLKPAKGE